jgi:hypothetical protein
LDPRDFWGCYLLDLRSATLLSGFVETNPRAWAPLVSKWALDTLGEFYTTKFILDPIVEFGQKIHVSVMDPKLLSDPKKIIPDPSSSGSEMNL